MRSHGDAPDPYVPRPLDQCVYGDERGFVMVFDTYPQQAYCRVHGREHEYPRGAYEAALNGILERAEAAR